ncbi:hypothetical protein POJ06DRAFT_266117 [Lipomyces tetrasporus]|uniref:Uncharacterized protein n=1 Tax=Lipomyces tetrasporus TaxID=54092 RepID=A0AAD7QXS5_9ASCO|nr:uncharacterized protein POJ06DRAFT_266117 [Lipomyces tetrasporus]KAJ8103261.1 hypothetical protein POJ06DRAFT_266117 [Lipomyces tetrasporus]
MTDFGINNLFSVEGLVCVVTGGGTGIGLMMATALENNGAIVYIVGRRLNVLENAVKLYSKRGNMIALQGDVTSKEDLLRATSIIKEKSGHVDFLVVNSGVMSQMLNDFTPEIKNDVKSLSEFWMNKSQEDWGRTFNVNVTSVFFTTVAFLELLDLGNKKREKGKPTSQVVVTGSIGGFMRITPFAFTYNVSKAATMHLGKMLATFFVDYDIRVNILAPGMYPSQMTGGGEDKIDEANKIHLDEYPREIIPLRRAGSEEEMGGAILYLASAAGGYSTGSVLVTDGGRLSTFPSVY